MTGPSHCKDCKSGAPARLDVTRPYRPSPRRVKSRRSLRCWAIALVMSQIGLFFVAPASASTPVTAEDLQATIRSLGFLETLPRGGSQVVGIVYDDAAGSRDRANETAQTFNALPKPSALELRAEAISADKLGRTPGTPPVIYLTSDLSADKTVAALVQKLRLVSISNDPACLDTKSCVLMVRAGGSVEIVLDTALAASVGARFSSIFSMMVKLR
jgi:hypothetical protein